jgi:GDP-D-mannose dehydratase
MLSKFKFEYPFFVSTTIKPSAFHDETFEQEEIESAPIKIRAAIILEMLKKLNIGKSNYDLSKICKLISYLTGCSYNKIYNIATAGIIFTDYHKPKITEANKILQDLNAGISIDKNKYY